MTYIFQRFRKKPVEITAVRWDGTESRQRDIVRWANGQISGWHDEAGYFLRISTLEGELRVSPGDWVIRGIKGEFYPCKPDIFEATYEPIEVTP